MKFFHVSRVVEESCNDLPSDFPRFSSRIEKQRMPSFRAFSLLLEIILFFLLSALSFDTLGSRYFEEEDKFIRSVGKKL